MLPVSPQICSDLNIDYDIKCYDTGYIIGYSVFRLGTSARPV
jgi:hypothetical protein